MLIKRIYMAEADASGGNGAVPVIANETPPEPAALTPAAPVPSVDPDAIAAKVRDSLFAELRKAGVFEKPKPTKGAATEPTATQPDPIKLRSLDRALTKAGLATRLSDSQYQRAEKAFVAEDPSDVTGWVAEFFDGFGGSQAPTVITTPAQQANQAATPKLPTNAQPASDRGSPPPSAVPLHEADLRTMSETDRAHLIKEKGLVWYRNQLGKQLKGSSISFK